MFKYTRSDVETLTKRNLLATTSKLFDPLGFLGPILNHFEIIMQQIWVCGLNWVDEVPEDIKETWKELQNDLPAIRDVQIPRSVVSNGVNGLQILIFSDASEKFYAAVAFSRVTDEIGHVNVALLSSKNRNLN